jgi:3-phenylpropionate/trans-cinnamate dioxygenase ferredoxin subunit
MEFVKVMDVSELPAGQKVRVVVAGREILLANLDGSYYAIANKCSHLGGSLAKGTLEGKTVTCPKHGAQFNVETGKAEGKAKIAVIKMGVKDLESYQVKVEGTSIMVGVPH